VWSPHPETGYHDILFVEGMKDYLRIHTSEEKIMTLLNFAKLEELLPARLLPVFTVPFWWRLTKLTTSRKTEFGLPTRLSHQRYLCGRPSIKRLKGYQ
jgi:hypothetical protein